MKTLLLLGGGNCQRSAAIHAASLPCRVVLADYTPHPPAAPYAAAHLPVSTFDIPACTDAARSCRADGVMTLGTDQPVYTAARVAEALGLPSLISVQTALAVTNKQEMKRRLTAHGIPTVPYAFLSPGDGEDALSVLHPPLVIKPLDSQGQRGIFKLSTPREVLDHLEATLAFSRQKTALAESFYPSDEVTVSAWVRAGEPYLLTVTDRLLYPSEKHIGVCIGHRCPSVHSALTPEFHRLCRALCSACEITDGPLYVQFLVGDKGICVNELACRIGGAFEDFVIPFITGFDILDAAMRSALGDTPDLSALRRPLPAPCEKRTAVQLLFCRGGGISAVTPVEELLALPFVRDAGYNYAPGNTIPLMENATARFGHAVLTASDDEEMRRNITAFYRCLSVRGVTGEEMLLRLYPEI